MHLVGEWWLFILCVLFWHKINIISTEHPSLFATDCYQSLSFVVSIVGLGDIATDSCDVDP